MSKNKRVAIDFVFVAIGCIFVALGIDLFLVPNKIAAGGVSGLATVIYYIIDKRVPVGIIMIILNVPIFIFGFKYLGKYFSVKTLFGTVLLSVFVDILKPFTDIFLKEYILKDSVYTDLLLYAVFGGIFVGIGLGLIFRVDATTGGSDLLAAIVRNKKPDFTNGQILMIIDALVVAFATLYFKSFLIGLYAIVTIFVTTKIMDAVLEGVSFSRAVFIISDKSEEISEKIINDLNRGATALSGYGVYTKATKEVILCVINRGQIPKLKGYIKDIDPNAFVILTDIREVLGEGFMPLK